MEAKTVQRGEFIDWTADGTYYNGDVVQVPDGRAGIVRKDCVSGELVAVEVTQGLIVEIPKTTPMHMMVGSKIFWDHSANKGHLLHGGDRDFYAGVVVEVAASADTTVNIALNQLPVYAVSLEHGFSTIPINTAGFPFVHGAGREGANLGFSATAEAQKVDALSLRAAAAAAIASVHALVCINNVGDAAALDFNVGIANGTHATDGDSITESLFAHIDGNLLDIKLESDDGTTEVAATDSTVDAVAGTPFLVQWDLANLEDIQVYINGVNVLPASVFKLNAAAGPLRCLAHLEKTADDTPGNFSIGYLGMVLAQ
jgi:predicted RecA/RadA family phage recombinase